MRVWSLVAVLVVARVLGQGGASVPLSPWSLPVFLWHDIAVVLAYALFERALVRCPIHSRSPCWLIYGAVVAYVALNVPVVRVLSSPLTFPMLRAARGTLADSIAHHATAANLLCLFVVIATGASLPFVLRRLRPPGSRWLWVALPVVMTGPYATSRIDTRGLHRNAISALVAGALPRVPAANPVEPERDWRASPLAQSRRPGSRRPRPAAGLDLRGDAAGRNVIHIILESTGAQYLRPWGAGRDPMPTLSRLANDAILFENAYAVYPESVESLMATFCSRYPAIDTNAEDYEAVDTPSLARLLGDAGYRTALFHSGRFGYLGMESIIRERGFEVLEDAGAIGGDRESSFGVDEGATVNRMLRWIDSLAGQRFFVAYLPIAGHHPYDTPEPGPFPEDTERGRYLNALNYADSALAILMAGLEKRGLLEDTVLVIHGDHGEAFGQHEGNFGHSLFLYEENIRVPFLIVAPGLIAGTRRVSRVVSLIDLPPTVLDLVGLPLRPDHAGASLLEPGPRMALFFADYSLALIGLRDRDWKYIHDLDTGRDALFDLAHDPRERYDIAGAHPDRVAAYRRHLRDWAWRTAHRYGIP